MKRLAVVAAAVVGALFLLILLPDAPPQRWLIRTLSGNGGNRGRQWPAAAPTPAGERLAVAVSAMISPERTYTAYGVLFAEVALRLGRMIELVQRGSYNEVNTLLADGKVDIAWICTGAWPALARARAARLLVVPVVEGKTTYRAYVVAGPTCKATTLAELSRARFAYTDPLSLTGCTYPKGKLIELGKDPESFFSQTIYTHAHDNSIDAVRRGIADAASVDSLVFEFVARHYPYELEGIRVVERSQPFPIPPIVASSALPAEVAGAVQRVLLDLAATAEGKRLLAALAVDRFAVPDAAAYAQVE